jgi:GNAT superfamily N-acetyltransferase
VSPAPGGARPAAARPAAARVRPMRREDAAGVAGLAGQLGYPSTKEQIERRLAEVGSRGPAAALVAEVEEGRLVGWGHVYVVHGIESDPHAEVGGLVVDASARGRGVGRALMDAIERWAAAQGLAEVALRSNVIRGEAHAFYRALGYESPKTQHKFRKRIG